jgi:predicted transcriptional regulator of viral defense system
MAKQLGKLETQFFAYSQQQKKEILKTGDIVPILNISAKQERELFSRLARSGIIVRLVRGVYLIPERIPPGGKWSPGEYVILNKLMKELDCSYQISGLNTFNFYGFSEQIPNRIYVYNNKLSCERNIGGSEFVFIKVDDNRLGGTYEFITPEGIKVVMSSKSRTLLDAVYDWSRYNTIPKAYNWIANCIEADKSFAEEFVKIVIKYGNQGTLRRIGFLLSNNNIEKKMLEMLKKKIRKSKSIIPWIPAKPAKGTINKEWGIIINE